MDLLQKVHVEDGAPILAVRDRLEPHVLLQLDDLADVTVLDLTQGLVRQRPLGVLMARRQQLLGSQQTTDVVGPERRRRT
jgi:hypothetical protein